MGENSKIEWTNHSFNPWIGCQKVSPGCANCYAESDWDKRRHVAQWGPHGTRVVTAEDNWKKPLRWNKQAAESGARLKVFCASLADVFEDWNGPILSHDHGRLFINPDGNWMLTDAAAAKVPFGSRFAVLNDVRSRLFHLIDSTPHLDWILVTKRPENVRRIWPVATRYPDPSPTARGPQSTRPDYFRKNVWLLTSVENQEQADKRIPELLKCRDLAPVLGISAEPLLGPIDIQSAINRTPWTIDAGAAPLHWVIVGGESGHKARPMHPDWVVSLRDQCRAAEVPFFFKQWGEYVCQTELGPLPGHPPISRIDCSGRDVTGLPGLHHESDAQMVKLGKKLASRYLHGIQHNEFPQVADVG